MESASYKLFDENLVRNIMMTTAITVYDFIKEHEHSDRSELCEFVDISGDYIIDETIENMNNLDNDDEIQNN